MNMEIARLANVYWLLNPNQPQATRRATLLHPDRVRMQSNVRFNHPAECLPALDWPSELFDDAICEQ